MKTPPDITVPHAFDPVVERAERQMRLLAQLPEIGLGLARRLVDEVSGGASTAMLSNAALGYSRIARTVRQCIALEAKIDEALREWQGLSEAERAERRAVAGAKASETQARAKAEIEDAVEVERVSGRGLDVERCETERPERFWADSYVIEDENSFVDIVTKVCRDLGVTPDWSGWSEDGAGDLVVRPDKGNVDSWRGGELGLASGLEAAGRGASPRGPPSYKT